MYFFARLAKRIYNHYTFVTMRSSSTQTLASNTIPQLKEPEFLGEMFDSRTGTGNVKETRVFFSTESKEVIKNKK